MTSTNSDTKKVTIKGPIKLFRISMSSFLIKAGKCALQTYFLIVKKKVKVRPAGREQGYR
jgi:hypothetical protein